MLVQLVMLLKLLMGMRLQTLGLVLRELLLGLLLVLLLEPGMILIQMMETLGNADTAATSTAYGYSTGSTGYLRILLGCC